MISNLEEASFLSFPKKVFPRWEDREMYLPQ